MKKTLIVATLAILSFATCKKSDSSSNNVDKVSLLCGKTYGYTSITMSPGIQSGGVTITDLFSTMSACDKDNTFTYKTDGTYIEDEGATKCSATDPQSTPGTWKFINNQTQMIQDGTDTATVLQVDGTILKLQTVVVDPTIGKQTVTATFTKK